MVLDKNEKAVLKNINSVVDTSNIKEAVLNEIISIAYNMGWNDGRAVGHEEGYREGFDAGYDFEK